MAVCSTASATTWGGGGWLSSVISSTGPTSQGQVGNRVQSKQGRANWSSENRRSGPGRSPWAAGSHSPSLVGSNFKHVPVGCSAGHCHRYTARTSTHAIALASLQLITAPIRQYTSLVLRQRRRSNVRQQPHHRAGWLHLRCHIPLRKLTLFSSTHGLSRELSSNLTGSQLWVRSRPDPISDLPGTWLSRWTNIEFLVELVRGKQPQYIHSLFQKYGTSKNLYLSLPTDRHVRVLTPLQDQL